MDRVRAETTRFSVNVSRYISIYYKNCDSRYSFVSELWLNHGKTARFFANASTIRAGHEGQSLKQVNVLFVLQKSPVQAWQLGLAVTAQVFG